MRGPGCRFNLSMVVQGFDHSALRRQRQAEICECKRGSAEAEKPEWSILGGHSARLVLGCMMCASAPWYDSNCMVLLLPLPLPPPPPFSLETDFSVYP